MSGAALMFFVFTCNLVWKWRPN